MVRVACVGGGAWGANLIRKFSALGALQAICDSDPETLKRHAKAYPQVAVTESFASLLKNPAVDAVVIATPAGQHASMVKQALEAGKDVFVEKPLALTLSEGREVIEMAEQSAYGQTAGDRTSMPMLIPKM